MTYCGQVQPAHPGAKPAVLQQLLEPFSASPERSGCDSYEANQEGKKEMPEDLHKHAMKVSHLS